MRNIMTPAPTAGRCGSPSLVTEHEVIQASHKAEFENIRMGAVPKIQSQKSSSLMARNPLGSVISLSATTPRTAATTRESNSQTASVIRTVLSSRWRPGSQGPRVRGSR